jgi:hypothetical protein
MDRERAETYLRRLAEAELRHAAGAAPVSAGRWSAERTDATIERMTWVAMALTSVRALDVETAEAVLADYAAALTTRPRFGRGRPMPRAAPSLPHGPGRAPWFTWPTLGRQVGSGSPRPAGSRGRGRPDRLLPLGLTIGYCHDGLNGALHLLSYSRTASGARFAIAWQVSSAAGRPPPLPCHLFEVTDDQGGRYRLSFTGSDGSEPVGEIRLHPDPPEDVQWFELAPPGGPTLRVDVNPGSPPDDTHPWVQETGLSAGEHLLTQFAERLLIFGLRSPSRPRQRPGSPVAWLGDVVAALTATGTLPPVSPVPGQVAALCTRLGVTGHGITAPPAHDLPQPWLSLLVYQNRKPDPPPAWDGFAAVAATLPELNGTRLALLGVLSLGSKTVLYLRASGQGNAEPADQDIPLSIWARDSDGRWHVGDLEHWSRDGREHVLTLYLVPPLSRFAAWIELMAAGPSSEVGARFPLRWQ